MQMLVRKLISVGNSKAITIPKHLISREGGNGFLVVLIPEGKEKQLQVKGTRYEGNIE